MVGDITYHKTKENKAKNLKGGSTSQIFDHYKRQMLHTTIQNTLS
jgi:hypothetical protein